MIFDWCITPFEIPFLKLELAWPPLVPRTHVEETDKEIIVYFEIPGVKKEEIELYASERTLRLRAKIPEEIRRRMWKPKEYRKTLVLTVPVDPEKATSKYEDGILRVVLPKKAPGRTIPIE
ncbi:hypothetical protein DRN86_02980 [Candidatus Geothermarchaeota archaeon]|nr:MAG: hypothetical protein DRN86_02980 [Candidatus Geothermarchaeota archaeon]